MNPINTRHYFNSRTIPGPLLYIDEYPCCEPLMSTTHICPLCHSPTTPSTTQTYNSTTYKYEAPNPHRFLCTSTTCRFISDSRLLDAVGLVTNRSGYTITSDYDRVAADATIELLPWSSIRERLRTLDPDPQIVTINWPDNPSSGQWRRHGWGSEPASTSNTSQFTLFTMPVPLYLGTDLDDLRRLSRRLGPLQVPPSLRLPTDDSDLFLLKSPPPSCPYPVVTCNPRAAKAKASLKTNTLTRAREKAAALPLPTPTFYIPVLDLLPFNTGSYKMQLAQSELEAAAVAPKYMVDRTQTVRRTAATAVLSYLCLLLHDPRRNPAQIPIPTSAFTYDPKSTSNRGLRQKTVTWSRTQYHSPCTRWWQRNPQTAAKIHDLLAPVFDPLPTIDDLEYPLSVLSPLIQRLDDCSLSRDALLFLFRRLRLHANLPVPTYTPPPTVAPTTVPSRPLNVKGPIASFTTTSESTTHV